MTLEERIRQKRKALGYSQEYVAQQLRVSRQAVSKWESGKSVPDTNNLIVLAELLDCSVQWLLVGDMPQTIKETAVQQESYDPDGEAELSAAVQRLLAQRRRRCQRLFAWICAGILPVVAALLLAVHLAPVSRDAGACGGGFGTWIFDKESPHLTGMYRQSKEDGYKFEALRGTQEVSWSGRTIIMAFDIRYKNSSGDTVTDRVCFRGKRVWTECYRWRIWTAEQQSLIKAHSS